MSGHHLPLRRYAALAACVGWSLPASAAPCGRPDVDASFPPANASAVPQNATLSAHLAAPALYDDEPVTLVNEAGDDVALRVSYDEALSLLRATPTAPLAPGSHHLKWPGIRGAGGGGVGLGQELDFVVSARADDAPPRFEGLVDIDWDLSRERDPCLDRLEDRFVFRLTPGTATDDSGGELLALLVFQTRDPIAPAQTEPTLLALRPFQVGALAEVRRPATAAGSTCFAAVVQDLAGSVSGGGEREVCITTSRPPFFEGCATRPGTKPSSLTTAVSALVALLACRRGRVANRRA